MKDLIATGRVSAVYPANRTAKVFREDKNIVSAELKILQRGDDWLPREGDSVTCLFLPRSSEGFILGKY